MPIIKLVDSLLGCNIDISVNIRNGIAAASVMREQLQKWPVIRPLAYVLKQFLLQRGLNEVFTGGLSSFSTVALIISFLQMHPRIQRGDIDPMENLGVLLLDLLQLYGGLFNFEAVKISIRGNGSYHKMVV